MDTEQRRASLGLLKSGPGLVLALQENLSEVVLSEVVLSEAVLNQNKAIGNKQNQINSQ